MKGWDDFKVNISFKAGDWRRVKFCVMGGVETIY